MIQFYLYVIKVKKNRRCVTNYWKWVCHNFSLPCCYRSTCYQQELSLSIDCIVNLSETFYSLGRAFRPRPFGTNNNCVYWSWSLMENRVSDQKRWLLRPNGIQSCDSNPHLWKFEIIRYITQIWRNYRSYGKCNFPMTRSIGRWSVVWSEIMTDWQPANQQSDMRRVSKNKAKDTRRNESLGRGDGEMCLLKKTGRERTLTINNKWSDRSMEV